MSDREARANRLRDFFELQLRFAGHLAQRTGIPLAEAVIRFTNFHRRFGLGDPDKGVASAWADYVNAMAGLADLEDRTSWTLAFFRDAPEEKPAPGQHLFGCFGCEPPDDRGIVRIHFVNVDGDGLGPLHRSKVPRRQRELAAMFAFVRQHYPSAARVRGISWLYHIDAYRRLFPPDYTASATAPVWVRLNGMSSWGQFIGHDATIRPALRDAFLRNFDTMDVAAPWRSFPLPALIISAPVETFSKFYERLVSAP